MIKKIKLLLAGLMVFPAIAFAQIVPAPTGSNDGNSYSGKLLSNPGLAYSANFAMDLSVYDASKFSAQVIFSTVTFANVPILDGSQSTGSYTISSYAALSSAAATDQVTITTNGLAGACLTLQYNTICEGQQWALGASTQASALNIAAAISLLPNLSAGVGGAAQSVVYATATYGSYANSYVFTSNSSSMVVTNPLFSGGADNAVVTINGKALTQGTGSGQWAAATNNATTATNLAAVIAAAGLGLNAAASGAVVTATSTLNGAAYNYSLLTSTPTALSVLHPTMINGTNPGLALGGKVLTDATATGLTLGLPVLFPVSANPAIGGLTQGTTYYAYPTSNFSFELALYSTSAVAGSPASDFIVVTGTNSQVTAHTYTISALPWLNAATFIWQSSDDNSNWFTSQYTGNVSTGTVTIYSTTTAADFPLDFGVFNYRYLRFSFTAPTDGALNISVPVNIKQDGIGRF